MPPRRHDPAQHAAQKSPESYASIWSELSEAQRAGILDAINSTGPEHRPPAVQETMHALRRELLDDTLVAGHAAQAGRSAPPPTPAADWGWRPGDNGLVAASFDPALIAGGNAPECGVLICQRVVLPPGTTVRAVLLEVVTAGGDLTTGTSAVYEADGRRSGVSTDQVATWTSAGLARADLAEPIPPQPEPRAVWVAFVADGAVAPGFAVPWISPAARPNLGLRSPGPQRAGEIGGLATCPEAITPAAMLAGQQYWAALA